MHDPMTVAFDIKSPFWTHRPWPKPKRPTSRKIDFEDLTPAQQARCHPHWREGYRNTLVTIWHVDPECDGSDDSCGWFEPPLTQRQRDILKSLAWGEGREPYLRAARCKRLEDPVLAETLARAGLLQVARALDIKLSYDEASVIAVRLTHCQLDSIRGILCTLPGYHTNFKELSEQDAEELAYSLYRCLARPLLRAQRKWWQHPRWHIWHWKLQIHWLQSLKRWLFSRCCRCHRGFRFGETVCSGSWEGVRPRWFRGEPHVYHSDCMGRTAACVETGPKE